MKIEIDKPNEIETKKPSRTEIEKPSHIVSLATSAVLVSIDVNVWSATKQDRVISGEVTQAKNADSSAGRFVKNLLADNIEHKRVSNYRQTIYNWLKRNTFRWNNSQDLLPVIGLEKFKKEYTEHEAEFYRLLGDFLDKYSSIVSDMAFKQGDMFNKDDYPDVEQVKAKFGIKLFVSEVPSHDWRCKVSEETAEDLIAQYQNQAEDIVTGILGEQVGRLVEVMESISHCCGVQVESSAEGETKTKRRKIYDTTIEKAREMCSLYKEFNLGESEQLSVAVDKLEQALSGVSAEQIRESDAVRNKVKRDVDDILSKFSF